MTVSTTVVPTDVGQSAISTAAIDDNGNIVVIVIVESGGIICS